MVRTPQPWRLALLLMALALVVLEAAPAPQLKNATPTPLVASALPQELVLTGARFQIPARVFLRDPSGDHAIGDIRSVTANSIRWAVILETPGTYAIFVRNPDSKRSNDLTITVLAPKPPDPPDPEPEPIPQPPVVFWKAALERAKVKASANDADWLALKAQADKLLTQTVMPYDRNGGPDGTINYGWQGSGWYDALLPLSIAYQVTGNVAYATKVRDVVASINAAGLNPITIDQGYPTRSAAFGLATAYGFTSQTWTDLERTATKATAQLWHDWVSVSAWQADGHPANNYFGGHILGMGLLGLVMDLPAVADHWRTKFEKVQTAFTSGIFQSGYPAESFNYGPGYFQRMLFYALAVRDLTGEDLVGDKPSKILQAFVDHRQPNRWQFSDEGAFSGATTGVINYDLPLLLTTTAVHPYNSYAKYFLDTMAPSGVPFFDHTPSLIMRVLFKDASVAPLDYRAVFPRARVSAGDNHLIWRDSWNDGATWISYAGNAQFLGSGDVQRNAGNIRVQVGNDYLLVNAGQWKGTTGVYGTPQAFDNRSGRTNTLSYPHLWNATYNGGQGYWGKPQVLSSAVTNTYAYLVSDLASAYHDAGGAGLTTLTRFLRTVVILQDNSIVVRDDVRGPDQKILTWHAPLNAWSLTADGALGTVGTSQLKVTSRTHGPLFLETDPVSDTNPTPITSRLEIRDSATNAIFLTVLQPTPAGVTPSTVGQFTNGAITVGSQTVTFTGDSVAVTEGGGGDVVTLTSDITLTGSTSLNWSGTAQSQLTVNANNHRIIIPDTSWTGAITIQYATVKDLGTASLLAIGNTAGTDYGYMNGANLTISHAQFHRSNAIVVFTANGATVSFNDSTVHPDQLVLADASNQTPWLKDAGTSVAAKSFKRNRIFQSPIDLNAPNWTVGGAEADANLFIGKRVGILPRSTVSGTVSYNYLHGTLDVTPQQTSWSQVGLITAVGSGVTVEHNVYGGAHWPTSVVDGILRDNVIFHAHGHAFIQMGVNAVCDRNILATTYPSVATYPSGAASLDQAAGTFRVEDVMSFTDTVIDARGSDGATNNFRTEAGSTLNQTGTKRITSGSDATVEGPLPLGSGQAGVSSDDDQAGFPFNDADILNGTYTVGDLLDYFRWVYGAPTADTPPAIVSTNKRPMVHAGPSFVVASGSAKLNGYGADDGLPSNTLTFSWSKLDGPGTVTFTAPTSPITSASVDINGRYVLQLSATDGALTSTSEVVIVFGSDVAPSPPHVSISDPSLAAPVAHWPTQSF